MIAARQLFGLSGLWCDFADNFWPGQLSHSQQHNQSFASLILSCVVQFSRGTVLISHY